MGVLELFAKEVFKEEVDDATHGVCTWEVPSPIYFQEVHADGLLHVIQGKTVSALPAPWNLIDGDEVVCELKMAGDHVDAEQWYKALLRRQAREVNRSLAAKKSGNDVWIGHLPLWMVSGYVPDWIRGVYRIISVTEGINRIAGHPFVAFWVAANDLPLREDLIPFLTARTGKSRKEFVRWVTRLRREDPSWISRMMGVYKMTITMEELREWVKPETEEDLKWQKEFLDTVYQAFGRDFEKETLKKGLRPLVHLFERRLGRALEDKERDAIQARLETLGAHRLGDVVLDLSPKQLADWLSDPNAA